MFAEHECALAIRLSTGLTMPFAIARHSLGVDGVDGDAYALQGYDQKILVGLDSSNNVTGITSVLGEHPQQFGEPAALCVDMASGE